MNLIWAVVDLDDPKAVGLFMTDDARAPSVIPVVKFKGGSFSSAARMKRSDSLSSGCSLFMTDDARAPSVIPVVTSGSGVS